jgi:5-(carboxyamino)imidazole ribonucleotide mutase
LSDVVVSILMGSKSDLPAMQGAIDMLSEFGVPHEAKVLSAHRAPDAMIAYVRGAEARGVQMVIAGAGLAAHLPGMVAAVTTIPVLGVPMKTTALGGMDSLLSIVQMPPGVPVATFAIGGGGAKNAALYAVQILALHDEDMKQKIRAYRAKRAEAAQQDL